MQFYLDNVRGFSKQTIPVKQINFLVGENSTGKTSLMGLFHMISSQNFWLSGDFSTKDFNFGKFSDFLSNINNEPTFQIGISMSFIDSSKNNTTFSAVCKFAENEGLAKIKALSIHLGTTLTQILIEDKKMKYQIEKSRVFNTDNPLQQIAHAQNNIDSKSLLVVDYDIPAKFPLYLLVELARRKSDKQVTTFGSLFNAINQIEETIWHSPIRVKPRRTYDETSYEYSSEGHHTPYLVRQILKKAKKEDPIKAALLSYGKCGGLFDSLSVKEYGTDSTSPFELDVCYGRRKFPINQVGYGVSQVLPVVVELLSRKDNKYFLIQQPEIHLHPKAQAALGQVFFDVAEMFKRKAFIETHSDFIIDRFRLGLSRNPDSAVSAQVLFFDKRNNGNAVTSISIGKNGEYSEDQPKLFRDFFVNEELELLRIR